MVRWLRGQPIVNVLAIARVLMLGLFRDCGRMPP
jgi:hypothetical protein